MTCNHIVSNTISIFGKNAAIIYHDMHRRHGRYNYEYPKSSHFTIGVSFGGVASPTAMSRISLVGISKASILFGVGGIADSMAYSKITG